jgi:N-sulfoglucosamine sulfohydrolase
LKWRLFSELKQQGDPRMFGGGDVFDRYEHADKGHVGFYEKLMRGEKLTSGSLKESSCDPRPAP